MGRVLRDLGKGETFEELRKCEIGVAGFRSVVAGDGRALSGGGRTGGWSLGAARDGGPAVGGWEGGQFCGCGMEWGGATAVGGVWHLGRAEEGEWGRRMV